MANRRARGVSRGARTRGLNTWTTILAVDTEITTGSVTSFAIAQDSDWVPSGGTSKATLKRVRGWLSCIKKNATGSFADCVVMTYIGLFDEDETPPAPQASSTYTDEDILWTAGRHMPFVDSAAAGMTAQFDIDSKAQRKMRNGQQLQLVVQNVGAASLFVSLVVRALLTRGSV